VGCHVAQGCILSFFLRLHKNNRKYYFFSIISSPKPILREQIVRTPMLAKRKHDTNTVLAKTISLNEFASARHFEAVIVSAKE
jgi:hypothetical protein